MGKAGASAVQAGMQQGSDNTAMRVASLNAENQKALQSAHLQSAQLKFEREKLAVTDQIAHLQASTNLQSSMLTSEASRALIPYSQSESKYRALLSEMQRLDIMRKAFERSVSDPRVLGGDVASQYKFHPSRINQTFDALRSGDLSFKDAYDDFGLIDKAAGVGSSVGQSLRSLSPKKV